MKFLVLVLCFVAAYAQEVPPEVNWGKCPQLEPTAAEQRSKGEVIQSCLENNPPPAGDSPTQEQIDQHRELITTCALKAEGWFASNNQYNYARAKKEIQNKNLTPGAEIISKHEECQKEAQENFPENNIPQVQLYQACMDYHITKICDIKITAPPQAASASASAASA